MALCLHQDTLVEGSSEKSRNIYEHNVCSLCCSFLHECKISCTECEKNVCIACFPHYRDIQFALYLKTCGLSGLHRTYRQFPESATTLFSENGYKTAIFCAYKEMLVKKAELNLSKAKAELAATNACIQAAIEAKKAMLQ